MEKQMMPASTSNTEWKLIKQYEVPGEPIPKGRPRMARAGRFVKAYTPKRTKDFERRVAVFTTAQRVPPKVPVRVLMRFIFKRPKRLMRVKDPHGLLPHTSKPDGDNVEKAVLDALNGVLYQDDAQVQASSWEKYYSEKDRGPRVELAIYVPAQEVGQ